MNLLTLHQKPEGWPLRNLRIPEAHTVTRGDPRILVAVIDIGYSFHPQHEGHLWENPDPESGGVSGWDFCDDDATLENAPQERNSDYHIGHHSFIVGEVIMCAPACRIMNIRVGQENPESWWRGVDFAVNHGAKILVTPHGYLPFGSRSSKVPLFYRGTDFSNPVHNPEIRRSLEEAYDKGCLILKGTADNRGRRAAHSTAGLDAVIAVGSSNRQNQPADIAASADYTEVAAPSGERNSRDKQNEYIWSTGGRNDFISMTGGCMSSGFAGGVAALVWSRFPELTNREVRQILRNTAQKSAFPDDWDPELGYGILDAHRAVSLREDQLCQNLETGTEAFLERGPSDDFILKLEAANRGVYDVDKALVTLFNGDPRLPASPEGTRENPVLLKTRQLGHRIVRVRGLRTRTVSVRLKEKPRAGLWVQAASLDLHGGGETLTRRIRIMESA